MVTFCSCCWWYGGGGCATEGEGRGRQGGQRELEAGQQWNVRAIVNIPLHRPSEKPILFKRAVRHLASSVLSCLIHQPMVCWFS